MEKMALFRSVCRAASYRCLRSARLTRYLRSIFTTSAPSISSPSNRHLSGYGSQFTIGIGNRRCFSEDAIHLPAINDPEIHNIFKDLMAASWDEMPEAITNDAKQARSKSTDDKAGQEILKNVFRAAEAVEEFGAVLMYLKMELDDSIGMSSEDVKPLSEGFSMALQTVFQRYSVYLDSFGPEEGYLRKKVETELRSKMIYLKMRCSGLGSEWGKVTVLDTSGLAGSYVEQRA